MKTSIIFLFTIFLVLFGTNQLQAQDFNSKKNNYLVLSKNIEQLKPILITANSLEKEDAKKFGNFYIIICGKTVIDMVNNSDFKAQLKNAKTQNIKVLACGISLKNFNISPDQIPNDIEITENGILHAFQLAKKGFFTLTI